MIPSTLKVGDKFTDGNRTYKVLEVCGEGIYISKVIDDGKKADNEPEKAIEKPVEKTEEKKYTKTEIFRMSNATLTELAKELGVEVGTGLAMKNAIVEKLGL